MTDAETLNPRVPREAEDCPACYGTGCRNRNGECRVCFGTGTRRNLVRPSERGTMRPEETPCTL